MGRGRMGETGVQQVGLSTVAGNTYWGGRYCSKGNHGILFKLLTGQALSTFFIHFCWGHWSGIQVCSSDRLTHGHA